MSLIGQANVIPQVEFKRVEDGIISSLLPSEYLGNRVEPIEVPSAKIIIETLFPLY